MQSKVKLLFHAGGRPLSLPGPADRLARLLVDDKDVRFRMIDLNEVQRPGGASLGGCGPCKAHFHLQFRSN